MQKIVPSLWFEKECEEAMNFYTALFPDSKKISIERYPDDVPRDFMKGMEGKVLTGIFELAGYRFMALDGGPEFALNPSISFFVHCEHKGEINDLWKQLSEGGEVRMALDEYPFSPWYGWIEDKYGMNWQLILSQEDTGQIIVPSLLFVGEKAGKAEESMTFYVDIFKNSSISSISRYTEEHELEQAGTIAYGAFELAGQAFVAMDSAMEHNFDFTEALSFYVACESQEEVDYFWEKLSVVPEAEQCGWLKDRYGVSWQIVPKQLGEMLADEDSLKSNRVMEAMLNMKKLDLSVLEAAYKGNE